MIHSFRLKNGDSELLLLDLGELDMIEITNTSSEDVQISFSYDDTTASMDLSIMTYFMHKIRKSLFRNKRIRVSAKGIDNGKYIIEGKY